MEEREGQRAGWRGLVPQCARVHERVHMRAYNLYCCPGRPMCSNDTADWGLCESGAFM